MMLPVNDPSLEAIADRVRTIVRQPGHDVRTVARMLGVSDENLERLVVGQEAIDTPFLLEVLGALVRHFGLDPRWLLSGEYDSDGHRRALELVEANGVVAERTIRDYFREQYLRLSAGMRTQPIGSQ